MFVARLPLQAGQIKQKRRVFFGRLFCLFDNSCLSFAPRDDGVRILLAPDSLSSFVLVIFDFFEVLIEPAASIFARLNSKFCVDFAVRFGDERPNNFFTFGKNNQCLSLIHI